jgi:hypothetical protein
VSTRLAHQTQKAAGIPNGMRTATVAAVTGSVVTLSISGGLFTAGVGVLSTYNPIVGDTVAVFRQDSSWLILGAIGASLGPQPLPAVSGRTPFTVTAVSNLVIASVPFGVTFGAIPVVAVNLNASTAVKWTCRAYNTTLSGFNIWIYSGDGTTASFNGNVEWTATAGP